MKSKLKAGKGGESGSAASLERQDQLIQSPPEWTVSDEATFRSYATNETSTAPDREAEIAQARELVNRAFPESPTLDPVEPIQNQPEKLIPLQIGAASAAEKANEDRYYYNEDGTAIVCDGVGSSDNGVESSESAVAFLTDQLHALDGVDNLELAQKLLKEALFNAGDFIQQQQEATGRTMASTASVAKLLQEDGKTYAVIGNVGDSPVYLSRNGKLTELTNYHRKLPHRDKRQALGKPLELKPDVFSVRLKPGDRLVVTSNGVRKNDPKQKQIPRLLNRASDPQQAAHDLVTKLNGISADARTAVVIDLE